MFDSMTAPKIPPSALKSGETDMKVTGDGIFGFTGAST